MTYKPDTDYLIKQAEKLLAKEELTGAFVNYRKAKNILIEKGSYFRAHECINAMVQIYKTQGKIGEAINLVLSSAQKLEDFKIFEVAAKLYENTGSLNYEMQDYDNAGKYFEKAAALYKQLAQDEKDDEMRNLSGILLMKSSEATYKIPNKKEKSEHLLLEGIIRFTGMKYKIPEFEMKLIEHVKKNEFIKAEETSAQLASMMKEIIESMSITELFNIDLLSTTVKSRLFHFKAEYLFFNYLLSRQVFDKKKLEEKGKYVKGILAECISMLKSTIIKEYDKEDVDRYCFDGLMESLMNKLVSNDDNEAFLEEFTSGFEDELSNLILDNEHYNLMKKIVKYGLELTKNDLYNMNMGKFTPIAPTLIKLLYSSS
ncbi:MAG: hypothetical protein ACFFCS_21875 [Candidatus Hodarchaeota archaeon]